MIQYFLFGNESYALTRTAVLLGEALEICFDGAAADGILMIGKNGVKVKGGKCRFPASFLNEGENLLHYTEQNGTSVKRFALEPLYRCGDMAGVKALEADKVSLSLLAHIRYLRGALADMEKRVARVEACCFASPLV